MSTSIHATDREAYLALADSWFPNRDPELARAEDIANHAAMVAAIDRGCDAAKDWFEDFQEGIDASGDAIIESHGLPTPQY